MVKNLFQADFSNILEYRFATSKGTNKIMLNYKRASFHLQYHVRNAPTVSPKQYQNSPELIFTKMSSSCAQVVPKKLCLVQNICIICANVFPKQFLSCPENSYVMTEVRFVHAVTAGGRVIFYQWCKFLQKQRDLQYK